MSWLDGISEEEWSEPNREPATKPASFAGGPDPYKEQARRPGRLDAAIEDVSRVLYNRAEADSFAAVDRGNLYGIPAWKVCLLKIDTRMTLLQEEAPSFMTAGRDVESLLLDIAALSTAALAMYRRERV